MLGSHQKSKNLILHVEQLKENAFTHEFEENPQIFPIIAEIIKSRQCEFLKPFNIRLKAFSVREIFEVQGTLRTRVRLPCSRCLKDFDSPLTSDFDLTYTQEMPGMTDAFEDKEIELRAEEIGMIYFRGEEINLEEGIQEQVVMAFPLQPLCNDTCKGLCPQCGSDLNLGDCGCKRESAANKFAVLKNLKLDKT